MTDLSASWELYRRLAADLAARPNYHALYGIFLQTAPLIGQLQGAVDAAARVHGPTGAVQAAEEACERLKRSHRKVGADIRLATEAGLALGMEAVLSEARETLERLEAI